MIRENEPLAPRTTLGVGGPARRYVEVATLDALAEALDRARTDPVLVLGGGSNLLVADAGFPGWVIRPVARGLELGALGRVRAEAGVVWDDLVAAAVRRSWAGIECLSGIPGAVGAAPIQNIGAYGQELAETLVSVEAWDRHARRQVELSAQECGFGYRESRFKGEDRDRYVVWAVHLQLVPMGAPKLRYGELRDRLGPAPSLVEVRDEVLAIRRGKSMVWNPSDPNHRSAGSFFTNPIVSDADADGVAARAAARGLGAPPRYPADDGRAKLSAAWLIERAGFGKGYGEGPAGLSTNHCLALINRGSARAEDLVRLAAEVRRGVRDAFGVTLVPEPNFVGFDADVDALLG